MMTNSVSVTLLVGVLGCGGEPASSTPEPVVLDSGMPAVAVPGTLQVDGDVDPLIDLLATDIQAASIVRSVSMLVTTSDGVVVLDESTDAAVALPAAQHSAGLALDAHTSLLLLDDALQVWDGTYLQPSPLQDVLPLPAETMVGHAEQVWLAGGGQLFHYAEGTLSAVNLGDAPQIRSLAASADTRVAVMAPHLLILDGFGGEVTLLDHQPDRLATSLTFDADGALWMTDGSAVVARRSVTGDWGELDAGGAVTLVMGNAAAHDVWLQTDAGALHHHDGRFLRVAVPDGDWVGVDPLGRLLVLDDGQLQRVSTRRSVAVAGLETGALLEETASVAFAATGADTLTALEAWVGTAQLHIDPELGTAEIDPVALPPGDHILRMTAEGPEGLTLTDLPFRTGDLPDAKWEDDIAPIAEQHCSRCHGEGAGLPLNTADLWRLNIGRILVEVVSQDMPLGGPYLSPDELALIRGWQAGGFQ